VRAFVYGLFPTGFAVFVSFALAKWGFENIYYVAHLLPLCMVFYVVLAWFVYLRQTSALAWSERRRKPSDVLGHYEGDLARGLPEDKASGKELRYLRDESGLIFRRQDSEAHLSGEVRNSGDDERLDKRIPILSGSLPAQTIGILLWSACQIAVIATVLYHWFGVGATYY